PIGFVLAACLTALTPAGCDNSVAIDNSNINCSLPRDTCRQTVGCFLDYSGQPDSYFCRAAKDSCEQLTNDGGQAACEQASGCKWSPGSCYCPEGISCLCGGGPPATCRKA